CLAEGMEWSKAFDRGTGKLRRGRGVGIGFKALVAPTTSMGLVNLTGGGSCFVHSSTVDLRQASDTLLAMIAAAVLDLDPDVVRVVHPDTDVTPYDMATLGSRSTFHMGHAVRLAAEDALQKMRELAAGLGMDPAAKLGPAPIRVKRYRL